MLGITLLAWLQRHRITQTEFARRLSRRVGVRVGIATVNRWARPPEDPSYTVPSPALLVAIREETAGAVDAASWYPPGVVFALRRDVGPRPRKAA